MSIEPRRRDRRHLPVIAALVAAVALLAPSQALASHGQEMIIQDDTALVYSPPSQVATTLDALEFPLWLPQPRHGRHVSVWAQIRPSPHLGTLQFLSRGSAAWIDVAHLTPGNPQGIVSTTVNLPAAGSVRLRWDAPGLRTPVYGRVATVR